jgi:purine-binding chemotaxis protein CheW
MSNVTIDGEEEVHGNTREFVTINLAGQLLGIPVLDVHDVLNAQKMTRIPLAPASVAGVLNLRGRIVTAIDLRVHLGFKERNEDDKFMSVVVEHKGDPYSLLIDSVGEVVSLPDSDYEKSPVTLDARLRAVCGGVYRLEKELLVVLEVDTLLDFDISDAA